MRILLTAVLLLAVFLAPTSVGAVDDKLATGMDAGATPGKATAPRHRP